MNAPHTRPARVIVVGGGITGLSAAYFVHKAQPSFQVNVLEARERFGGNIVTEKREGCLLDGGPDSFLRTKPAAVELCRELGLESEFTTSQSRKVYVANQGELLPLPAGMALSVPTRLAPMVQTPLLSLPGKLRMLGDLVLPKGFAADGLDESIAAFVERRFGREALAVAAPLLGGIYAGDIRELSLRATFPQLIDLELKHGSVIRGLFEQEKARQAQGNAASSAPSTDASSGGFWSWLRRGEAEAASPFYSLKGGMSRLIERLVQRLPQGSVRTSARVVALELAELGPRFRVVLDSGEVLSADAVILACPAHAATRLVPDEQAKRELSSIPYVSTATVFFAFSQATVKRPLDAVGFVVPRGEAEILASTWVSSKWEHRAPQGTVLVRAFLGGRFNGPRIAQASDISLVRTAHADLERLMGPLGKPRWTRVFRYTDSNPQPVIGHLARVRRIRERLVGLPTLQLAGAAYDGVGIPDCVRQAETAALGVMQSLTSKRFC